MSRCLLLLLGAILFSQLGEAATTTISALINWEGQARGPIVMANLPNGTVGSYDSWGTQTTIGRFTLVAGESRSYPSGVTIGGTTYTQEGTNWLQGNLSSGSNESFYFVVTGGASSGIHNAAICGFIKYSPSTNDGTLVNDLLHLTSNGGRWCISQMSPVSTGTFTLNSHSVTTESTFSPSTVALTVGKTYWHELIWDVTNNKSIIRVYDPDSDYSLIDQKECASDQGSEEMYFIKWNVGYTSNMPGNVQWGDQMVLYDFTYAQLDGIVTNRTTSVSSTVNVGTLRARTVTWK